MLDRNGNLNILQAIKPSNKPPSNQPAKPPNIKGVIHLKQITGTFQDDPDKMTLGLSPESPLNATITIRDINQPIEDAVDLGLQLQEKNLVKVKISGTLSAIRNNLVVVDHLAASQTIELSDGDLAPVAQVLQARGLNLNVTGTISGKIAATVDTLDNISADMGINVAELSAAGGELAGDTVAFSSVQVGLKASMDSTDGKNAAIKLDLPITAQPNGSAHADQITMHADVPEDSLLQTAEVFKAIAARLVREKGLVESETVPIAGAGKVEIFADLNVANLVSQLPHLTHLEPAAALSSGRLTHETTVTLADDRAVIATETHLKDFSGTNGGKPVRLGDIDTAASVTAVGGAQPDLRNIKLSLSSALANVSGGGQTLGQISLQGTSDLKAVQQQVSQIIDLDALLHAPAGSHVSLAGTLAFQAHTSGDLTAADGNVAIAAGFNATHVDIDIPGRRRIDEPNLTAQIGGDLHHTAGQFVQAVRNLVIAVHSPAITFQTDAAINFGGRFGVSVPSFTIVQGSIDPRLLQEEFGGALSLLVAPPAAGQQPSLAQRLADNSVRFASGRITISGQGEFDQGGFGFQQPLEIQLLPIDLTVADDLGTVQTVHIPQMSLVVSGSGSMSDRNVATVKDVKLKTLIGTQQSPFLDLELSSDVTVAGGGSISVPRIELTKCRADLPALQSTFGPLLPLVIPAPAIAQNILICTSGKLTASMSGSYDGTTFTLSRPLAVSIADLSLQQSGGGQILNDETIQLAAAATLGGDMSWIHDISVDINSSFARKISISDGQIVLQARRGDRLVPVGPLDMVQSAHAEVDDLDLTKVDALVNLLFAQAAAPRRAKKRS